MGGGSRKGNYIGKLYLLSGFMKNQRNVERRAAKDHAEILSNAWPKARNLLSKTCLADAYTTLPHRISLLEIKQLPQILLVTSVIEYYNKAAQWNLKSEIHISSPVWRNHSIIIVPLLALMVVF